MSKQGISNSQIKLLWGASAGRCAICRVKLIAPTLEVQHYHIGEMAHIQGEKPGSARYNSSMTNEERSNYTNLILLCPSHHSTIDIDEKKYTVEKLNQLKKEHEMWIDNELKSEMLNVTFAELEVLLTYLDNSSEPPVNDYSLLIPPTIKINKNNLSKRIEEYIAMGMLKVSLIEKYFNQNADIDFARRLQKRFVDEYKLLQNSIISPSGDSLFYSLWEFASNNSSDFDKKANGLSVLTYFFEKCMVFEP